MNRKVYRQLAKKHGVTTEEIRRDMQSALNIAYENPSRTAETVRAQNAVLRSDNVPTPEEFLLHAVREVRRRTEKG
ncbi:sporulation initiation factor Spo0A C-terminal domain-containing protein [Oscillibacter sp.]|uniref:sporulation initiation factor Spo0A C-terminal domain-containing protein n=1 Tax=Oscillibacter sp. TaxID=1945593 RepID=UPI00289F9304|nr:sporulation initiation factor Spo0A C-terminal domain-containing protein [Oscillibacter sp.]